MGLVGKEQGECPTGVQDGAKPHAESCLLSTQLFEQPGLVEDVPAHGRGLELDDR